MQSESRAGLSTGLSDLNAKFKQRGLKPGSLVAIQGKPVSLADKVTYNFIGGRETLYLSFGEVSPTTETALKEAGKIDDNRLTTVELSVSPSPERFIEAIEDAQIESGMTVLADPLNYLEESATQAELTNALTVFKRKCVSSDSLGVLRLVDSENRPATRWVTLDTADTVISIHHNSSQSGIEDALGVDKLHPQQEIVDSDTRVFELDPLLDTNIKNKQMKRV